MSSDASRNDRLRLPTVIRRTGLSKTEIYRRVKDGRFPASKRESHKMAYWLRGDIEDYLNKDLAELLG